MSLWTGVGASGEGRTRPWARPQTRADKTGEAGADCQEVRQEGGHEGDLAPGEPEAGGSGKNLAVLYDMTVFLITVRLNHSRARIYNQKKSVMGFKFFFSFN